jgi:hypothetical protein
MVEVPNMQPAAPPESEATGARWRRAFYRLGMVAAVAVAVYLIGGWLRAGESDTGTQLTIRDGWIVLRPIWLYPVAVLVIGLLMVLALAVLITRKQASGETWRTEVICQADALQHELDVLTAMRQPDDFVKSVKAAVMTQLDEARQTADPKNRPTTTAGRIVEAWSAARPSAAFLTLHAAEVAMVPLLPEEEIAARIPAALARLDQLRPSDQRRREAEVRLRAGKPGAQRRADYALALRLGYEIKDAQHAQLRSFRSVVYGTTLALTMVVIALCLIGASFPDAIPLCFAPTPTTQQPGTVTTTTTRPPGPTTTTVGQPNTICPSEEQPPEPNPAPRRLPAPGDVTLTALFGLLGGALSGAFTIRNLQGTSTPYSVPIALSLLKLPAGALTAIVGILLVRGEFIPGLSQLDNQPQILAYAFIFGIAQIAVTRYVDDRAQEVLRQVPATAAAAPERRAADPQQAPQEPALTESATRTQQRSRRRLLRR